MYCVYQKFLHWPLAFCWWSFFIWKIIIFIGIMIVINIHVGGVGGIFNEGFK